MGKRINVNNFSHNPLDSSHLALSQPGQLLEDSEIWTPGEARSGSGRICEWLGMGVRSTF